LLGSLRNVLLSFAFVGKIYSGHLYRQWITPLMCRKSLLTASIKTVLDKNCVSNYYTVFKWAGKFGNTRRSNIFI